MKKANLLTFVALAAFAASASAQTAAPSQAVQSLENKTYAVGYTTPPATFFLNSATRSYMMLPALADNIFTNASVALDRSTLAVTPFGAPEVSVVWQGAVRIGDGNSAYVGHVPALFNNSLDLAQAAPVMNVDGMKASGDPMLFGVRSTGSLSDNSVALFRNMSDCFIFSDNDLMKDYWAPYYPEYADATPIGAGNIIPAPASPYALNTIGFSYVSPDYQLVLKVYAYDEATGALGKVLYQGLIPYNGRYIFDEGNELIIDQAVAIVAEIPENASGRSPYFSSQGYLYEPAQWTEEQTEGEGDEAVTQTVTVNGKPELMVTNDLIPYQAALIVRKFADGEEQVSALRTVPEQWMEWTGSDYHATSVSFVNMEFDVQYPYLFAAYDWNAAAAVDPYAATVGVALSQETPVNDYRVACMRYGNLSTDQPVKDVIVTMADGSEDLPEWLTVTLTNPDEKDINAAYEEFKASYDDPTLAPALNTISRAFFNARFAISKNAPAEPKAEVKLTYKGVSQIFAINGETTGIDTIDPDAPAADAQRGIFDLQGRRLNNADAPGLYIIDGRKVLVR